MGGATGSYKAETPSESRLQPDEFKSRQWRYEPPEEREQTSGHQNHLVQIHLKLHSRASGSAPACGSDDIIIITSREVRKQETTVAVGESQRGTFQSSTAHTCTHTHTYTQLTQWRIFIQLVSKLFLWSLTGWQQRCIIHSSVGFLKRDSEGQTTST